MNDKISTYETLSISDLRQALLEPIQATGMRFKGWVIENLSVDPNSRLSAWKNGIRWINTSDAYGNKSKLCIPETVWNRAHQKGYEITNECSVDVAINSLSLDKWMQLQIEVMAIRVSGQSKLEALREKIIEYCKKKKYFVRLKKNLPFVIRKVAIITSPNSTIESDIINQIGIRNDLISNLKFDGKASNLKMLIEQLNEQDFDIIALYRGGREDEAMFIYSDPIVLDAVVKSTIPIVTAIGHERDVPPVQMVADKGFASPTKFAEFVRQRNEDALKRSEQLMQNINGYFDFYVSKIEKDALLRIGNVNAIASTLEQKYSTKKYKRNILLVILFSLSIIAIIVFYFIKMH